MRVLDREDAIAAWRRAEARVCETVTVNAELYHQYIGVMRAVAEELPDVHTEDDLVAAWRERRDVVRAAVARSASPVLAVLDQESIGDAAFCHRHREITREQGKALAAERIERARATGSTAPSASCSRWHNECDVSVTDELLANNEAYAASFDKAELPAPPAKKVVIIACMDARLNLNAMLGLQEGDAHVLRNAGGVVTDDEIRSLALSQRLLGTEEIILIHHTECGSQAITDDEFKRALQDETGIKPPWAVETFTDLDEDVRQSIARIKASPFIPRKESVRGFVYDVKTGRLREVD